MKILNLHGFMGEADNKNFKALCSMVSPEDIISPQLNYKEDSPVEILETLSKMVDSEDFIFVGQSLGGWYADKLSRKFKRPCILTNPCYLPYRLELIKTSGISSEFIIQYCELSEHSRNERAYVLCSDADTIIPNNYQNCTIRARQILKVHGSHSTIENVAVHLSDTLNKIKDDSLLLFTGRGSAFADEHNSAFFIEDNELIMLDCPASSFRKIKQIDPLKFNNIYILITHTHGDHSGGTGTMLQYVWFVSLYYHKNFGHELRKVTVVAPSEEVESDLNTQLKKFEGCDEKWFNIITADKLSKKWLISAVPTSHSDSLKGKCFGYHLNIKGRNTVYTGDTGTLEPFIPLLSDNSVLYTEASLFKSEVHICLEEKLPELTKLCENSVKVYLMHLDDEDGIRKIIEDTPLELAPLY